MSSSANSHSFDMLFIQNFQVGPCLACCWQIFVCHQCLIPLSLLWRCLIVAEKMVLGHQVRLWAALLILYKFGVPLSCLMVLGKNLRRLIVCLLSYLINVFYVYSLNLSGRNRRRIGRKSLVDDTWLRAVVELPCNDFPTRALAP